MTIFLKYLLYTLSTVSSLLLIAIIMVQQPKSGGGLGAVAGGVTENVFGTSAGNILTKMTTWLAVIFLASTLLLGTVIGRLEKSNKSISEKLLTEEVQAPAAEAPAAEAPAAAATTEATPAPAATPEAAPAPAATPEAAPAPAAK